jgi:hypothetical protein
MFKVGWAGSSRRIRTPAAPARRQCQSVPFSATDQDAVKPGPEGPRLRRLRLDGAAPAAARSTISSMNYCRPTRRPRALFVTFLSVRNYDFSIRERHEVSIQILNHLADSRLVPLNNCGRRLLRSRPSGRPRSSPFCRAIEKDGDRRPFNSLYGQMERIFPLLKAISAMVTAGDAGSALLR